MSKTIKTYNKLTGSIINGENRIKSGDFRQWNKVICTGRVRINRNGHQMTEVIDNSAKTDNKKRWLNMNSFSGTVKINNIVQTWKSGQKVIQPVNRAIITEQNGTLALELFFNCSKEEIKSLSESTIAELTKLVEKEIN